MEIKTIGDTEDVKRWRETFDERVTELAKYTGEAKALEILSDFMVERLEGFRDLYGEDGKDK